MIHKTDSKPISDKEVATHSAMKVNVAHQEAPQETLRSMRMAYTGQQAINDMRIVDESLKIMNTTNNIDTFFTEI